MLKRTRNYSKNKGLTITEKCRQLIQLIGFNTAKQISHNDFNNLYLIHWQEKPNPRSIERILRRLTN